MLKYPTIQWNTSSPIVPGTSSLRVRAPNHCLVDHTLEDLSLQQSHSSFIPEHYQGIARIDAVDFSRLSRNYDLPLVSHLHDPEDVFTVFLLRL